MFSFARFRYFATLGSPTVLIVAIAITSYVLFPFVVGDSATRAAKEISISLNGPNPLQAECGNPLADPGASATDISGKPVLVKVTSKVQTDTPGTYTLTYLAANDRDSVSIDRTVNVVDTTPPEISLQGPNPLTLDCSGVFVDPGAIANDSCQGSVPVTVSGEVNASLPNTYTISYSASDSSGNTKTVTRRVIVGTPEENPPTITVTDGNQMTLECGNSFIDPGATATVPCSGSLPVATEGTVNAYSLGDHTLIYTAAFGEMKSEASRVVTVVDTTAPVISLKGATTMEIGLHSVFRDPGAAARDACAGEYAATASGTVDVNKIGSYTLTYTAKDPSGNEATPVRRTVNVVEAPRSTSVPNLTRDHFPLISMLGRIRFNFQAHSFSAF